MTYAGSFYAQLRLNLIGRMKGMFLALSSAKRREQYNQFHGKNVNRTILIHFYGTFYGVEIIRIQCNEACIELSLCNEQCIVFTFFLMIIVSALTATTSVCAKLRACEPGYDITSSFFIHVLYKGFKGMTDEYELGFLQSLLLLKVQHPFSLFTHH